MLFVRSSGCKSNLNFKKIEKTPRISGNKLQSRKTHPQEISIRNSVTTVRLERKTLVFAEGREAINDKLLHFDTKKLKHESENQTVNEDSAKKRLTREKRRTQKQTESTLLQSNLLFLQSESVSREHCTIFLGILKSSIACNSRRKTVVATKKYDAIEKKQEEISCQSQCLWEVCHSFLFLSCNFLSAGDSACKIKFSLLVSLFISFSLWLWCDVQQWLLCGAWETSYSLFRSRRMKRMERWWWRQVKCSCLLCNFVYFTLLNLSSFHLSVLSL
jgi:hypothetical protein